MNHVICQSNISNLNPKTKHIPLRGNARTTTTLHVANHRSFSARQTLRLQASSAKPSHVATTSPKLIPQVPPKDGGVWLPPVGLGTMSDPQATPEVIKSALLEAIKLGYRHFDTSPVYQSEQPMGVVVKEAIAKGFISSREEIFITSKLWVSDGHPEHVVPALRSTLRDLQMDYIDVYLVHWPVRSKPAGKYELPGKDDFLPFELVGVWSAMEECHNLGLARAIGVSNYSCKKLDEILSIANIPPTVNQIEVNPFWNHKKLINYCKENGILVTAYSPLGAVGNFYGSNRVLECQILKEIAEAKGKTVPQVCLRWVYEQGITTVVKSFNSERMKENIDIFDWELSPDEHERIDLIPQSRGVHGWPFISSTGPHKTLHDLWDGEL